MAEIMDRWNGHAAQDVQALCESNPIASLRALSSRLAIVERTLVVDLRIPRAIRLVDTDQEVVFGSEGLILLEGDGTYVSYERDDHSPHHIKTVFDADALPEAGCANVWFQIDGDTGSITPTGCADTVKFTGDRQCPNECIYVSAVAGVPDRVVFIVYFDECMLHGEMILGYLRMPRRTGTGTYDCVAVPYYECLDSIT